MLSSISGQNERWAQIGAYAPPPVTQSGQNGVAGSTGSTPPPAGSIGDAPSAGSTATPLSDDMSMTLMAFNSGWAGGPPSGAAANSSAGQMSSTATAPADSTSAPQDETSPESQIFNDIQSLMSALTGSGGTATGIPATDASATAASGSDATDSGFSSTVLQDLQTVSSDLATMASTTGQAPPRGNGDPSPSGSGGPLPWSNDASDSGTATGSSGWNQKYSDEFQKQFAFSAYSANTNAALDSAATSSVTSITA